jgi:hypothetical protein
MANQNECNENIHYKIDDINDMDSTPELDLNLFLTDFEKIEMNVSSQFEQSDDYFLAQMSEYDLNYNLKQLTMIYEYYNIGKVAKLKKADIIQSIVMFEHDTENCDIVMRRQLLWHYLEELKADKFTKRFILSA